MKKTLRSALSLVLALVMCAALVLPASASSFTDKNEISDGFEKSVSLMVSLGIINGIEGSGGSVAFKPQNSLTREESAKILAYVVLGNDISSLSGYYDKSDSAIKDIADSWARDYIAYCFDHGIVNGDGNGRYFPQQTLSLAQAAKLLLSAAGYNDNGRYTGDNWNKNVMADAASAGLFDEFDVQPGTGILYIGSSQCSREQFCSMAAMTLAKLCKKDSANTLGKDNFNVMGVVTGEVSSITASGAVIAGTVTTNTLSLKLGADGMMNAQRTVMTAPVSLTVPASTGVTAGVQMGFYLRTADKTAATQLDTLLIKALKETDPSKVKLPSVGAALKLDAASTPKLTNDILTAKVSDTGIADAVSSEAVSAKGADLESMTFADSVTVYESGKAARTVTATIAKQLCQLNPGSTMNVSDGKVVSITLVSSATEENDTGRFPTTCLYFGTYSQYLDADNKLHWEIEAYGEGKTRSVSIDKLIVYNEAGSTVYTPNAGSSPNTPLKILLPGAKIGSPSGWVAVLRISESINGERYATAYAAGAYAKELYRVDACSDERALLTKVNTSVTTDVAIRDEYYGGCYNLKGGDWTGSALSIGDYVIAFWSREDGKDCLRAAYKVNYASD